MDIPNELKICTKFIQRSNELKSKEPIISYYCRLYAVQLGIKIGKLSQDSETFLVATMNELEKVIPTYKEKAALSTNEAITDQTVGYAYVENFALKIFANADTEDRNSVATKKTAKTFLAASVFLELLNVFEVEMDEDIHEKVRYAKFKVTDIMKALNENRIPQPGPPGGEPSAPSEAPIIETGNHLFPTTPTRAPDENTVGIPIVKPPQPSAPCVPNIDDVEESDDEEAYNEEERLNILQASKFSKFAQSALLYDDVKTAISNLEQALALLKPLRQFNE